MRINLFLLSALTVQVSSLPPITSPSHISLSRFPSSPAPVLSADVGPPPSPPLPSVRRGGSAVSSKMKDGSTRTLTAIALVATLVTSIKLFGEKALMTIMVLIQILAFREASALVVNREADEIFGRSTLPLLRVAVFAAGFVWVTLSSLTTVPPGLQAILNFGTASCVLVSTILTLASTSRLTPSLTKYLLSSLSSSLLALLILPLSLPILHLPRDYGYAYLLFPVVMVAMNDSMAYVFGCLFGRTKLIPLISPSKTVEGFVLSALFTLIVGYFLPPLFGLTSPAALQFALATNVFANTVAPFGGFLASAVKRAWGVKDFGKLMPGHGGVLDRMDCQLVALGFVTAWLKWKGV